MPFQVPYFAFALGWLISSASAILMFLVLYRFVPNVPLRFRRRLEGRGAARRPVRVLTQVFPLYLHFLGGGFAAYKALGVFLLLMTWFYFLSMILVRGGLLNAMLLRLQSADRRPSRNERHEKRQARSKSRGKRTRGDGRKAGGRG